MTLGHQSTMIPKVYDTFGYAGFVVSTIGFYGLGVRLLGAWGFDTRQGFLSWFA